MSPKPTERTLVIDASIAFSAGEMSGEAKICRDVLKTVYSEGRFKITISPQGKDEWERHASPTSRKFYLLMINERRYVETSGVLSSETFSEIEDAVEQLAFSQRRRKDLEKDLFLLADALETDELVLSNDNKARTPFIQVAKSGTTTIARINWRNPLEKPQESIKWLSLGAKFEPAFQLGKLNPRPEDHEIDF